MSGAGEGVAIPHPNDSFLRFSGDVDFVVEAYLRPHMEAVYGLDPRAELDARACLVLVHAALEEYFEHLSNWLCRRCLDEWVTTGGAPSQAAIALALRYPASGVSWEEDDRTHFERVRKHLADVVRPAHSTVLHNNHGAGLEYMRSLFCPLGVDIPQDINLRESLKTLATSRGIHAHRGVSGARVVRSPPNIHEIVSDCRALGQRMRDAVLAAR